MMRLFNVAVVSLFIVAGSSSAQGGSDLATELQRLIDGMASPDPTTRMIALDEATNSQRPPVRRKAIELGLTSSDTDLRAMALAASFRTKANYNVVILPPAEGNYDALNRHLAGNLDLQISSFDPSTGDFFAHSSMSKSTNSRSGGPPTYEARPGNVSGVRVQLSLSPRFGNYPQCDLVAELVDGSTMMAGTLRCLRHSNSITIAILE